jgi:YidC/Oxa1 family membrane protein insertase
MDIKRLVLFVIFSMSLLLIWDSWQKYSAPTNIEVNGSVDATVAVDPSVPKANIAAAKTLQAVPVTTSYQLGSGQRVMVATDLYQAEIETVGGDLRKLTLLNHRADDSDTENFVLLDDAGIEKTYVAQSGLLGDLLPTHKDTYTVSGTNFTLAQGDKSVEVRLSFENNGVKVDKIYTFYRGSYEIHVNYEITNGTESSITPAVYYQVVHDKNSNQGSALMPTFTGGAYYTDKSKFKKMSFSDMEKSPLSLTAADGWIGLLQHYFVSAWIPKDGYTREFYSSKLTDDIYSIGTKSTAESINAGATLTIPARLYAGPQTQKDLIAATPGLEYTVDYGWLTIVATPLFWLLSKIQTVVQNWGVAIILLTILIKAAFFKLSATSYRSMAQMRELAPRLQSMKEKFGDDRQKMQVAMMELYKKEKINPLGGCLPIVIQIPVFIALYWVLLGSVELRHAPFFGWIHDLSAIDPFYILPILMGATMIIQTRLNPKPTDPIQAKVMTWMPVVFSVFFFFFPAGLVLYWLVNNILSIAQQWYINKTIHAETLAKKVVNKR